MAEETKLQLSPIDSNQMFWQLQPSDAKLGTDADKVVFRTDGSISKSTSIGTADTMDGEVSSAGSKSEEASFTSYVVANDPSIATLEHCWQNGIEVKVWRSNLKDKNVSGYETTFFYALIENLEESESTGDKVELSVDLKIQGLSKKGRLDIPQDVVDVALYGFEKPGEWTGSLTDSKRSNKADLG